MVEFQLQEVTDDWWLVTTGMAPDGIYYTIIKNGREQKMMSSLAELLALYKQARERSPTQSDFVRSPFEVEESNDTIYLSARRTDFNMETTYEALSAALQPFLGEIFMRLDKEGNPENRANGLKFIGEGLDINLVKIYNRLV